MMTGLKEFDVDRLKPLAGFAPVDESKLANVKLRLAQGRTLATTDTRRSFAVIARAHRATRQLDHLPGPGEAVHCVLDGTYALFDFIPAMIDLSGQPIDELHVATLSFSKKNVDALAALVADGLVGGVTMLCSHYFAAQDRDIYDHMAQHLPRSRLVAMRTHAKVLLIKQTQARYTVESSANLRSCHNVEQATLIHDAALYDFHRKWMEDLVSRAQARRKD